MLLFLKSALIAGSMVATAADGVPRFDVEAGCRSAQPLTSEDKQPVQNCIKDEDGARGELEKQWADFPAGDKGRCIGETHIEGKPSYVELLVCLQMAKWAKEGSQGTPPARKQTR